MNSEANAEYEINKYVLTVKGRDEEKDYPKMIDHFARLGLDVEECSKEYIEMINERRTLVININKTIIDEVFGETTLSKEKWDDFFKMVDIYEDSALDIFMKFHACKLKDTSGEFICLSDYDPHFMDSVETHLNRSFEIPVYDEYKKVIKKVICD